MNRVVSPGILAPLLTILVLIGIVISITQGPMTLPAIESLWVVLDSLFGSTRSGLLEFQQVVVWELRFPRTLMAVCIGALLSMCGAVTQGIFRNPLADPGIIGVSTGAGLGAALAIVYIPVGLAVYSVPIAAFSGGLLTTLLVYRMAQSGQGTSVLILLLAGVAIAAFSGAAIGFLTYVAEDDQLRDLTLWGMGSLNGANFKLVAFVAMVTAGLAVFFRIKAAPLNALLLGEPEARHLGIDVERLKLHLIIAIAIGTGVAVSATGVIGFLGLVVPHLVRMLVGPDHRMLIPLSAMLGAALLLAADIAARLLMSPAELPVGLMTSLFGAPFLTFLLIKQRNLIR